MTRAIRLLGASLITVGVILAVIACTRVAEGARFSPGLTLTIASACTLAICGTVASIGSWLARLLECAAKQRAFVEQLVAGTGDGDTGELVFMSGRRNGRGAAN